MRWDGMGTVVLDRIGRDGIGLDGMGWDGTVLDGMGWDRIG